MSKPTPYTDMSLWELAARHDYARNRKGYAVCRQIEQVVMKMSRSDQIILSRLNYYEPVGSEVIEFRY
jgi:hypothetical protein